MIKKKKNLWNERYSHYLRCVTGVGLCQNPTKYHFKYVHECLQLSQNTKFNLKNYLALNSRRLWMHLPAAAYFDVTQNATTWLCLRLIIIESCYLLRSSTTFNGLYNASFVFTRPHSCWYHRTKSVCRHLLITAFYIFTRASYID